MAGVNSTNVGLTYTNYLYEISETLNHKSKGRQFAKKSKPWAGSHLEWRLHDQRTSGVGPMSDGSQFPIAGKQGYDSPKAYRRMTGGKIQLTDGVMSAAKKGKQAARDAISSETKGLMRDLLKYENFFFWRSGDGVVATIVAASTDATQTVDDSRGLWEGQTYDRYNSSDTFQATTPTVSYITSAPTAANRATVEFASSIAASSNDYLEWLNSDGTNVITGLKGLIDDTATTFQNINVATVPKYASLVMSNSGTAREMTPTLHRQMLAGIKQKGGWDGQRLTVCSSNWDGISFEEMYEGDIRVDPSTKVAGFAVQRFQSFLGSFDIVTDPDMLLGSQFYVDFGQIYRGVQKPLAWRRDGKGSIFQRSDVSAVYTATALEIAEYFIKERHTSGRLDDLSYSRSTVY